MANDNGSNDGPPLEHVGHPGQNIAYHMEWEFRAEAIFYIFDVPLRPNLIPLGSELREWLLQKGQMRYFPHSAHGSELSNPYTCDASLLALAYGQIVNDAAAFARATDDADAVNTETRAIRFMAELTLYSARVCEVLIKQLLFCTAIPRSYYEKAALGRLLSLNCRACRNSATRHNVSLMGSLAHRYHRCLEFEHCLADHLRVVARRRNVEAAHSSVVQFVGRSSPESRAEVASTLTKVGEDTAHLLKHVGELEHAMFDELKQIIRQHPEHQ